jgi:hypothetical protein
VRCIGGFVGFVGGVFIVLFWDKDGILIDLVFAYNTLQKLLFGRLFSLWFVGVVVGFDEYHSIINELIHNCP